MTDKAISPLRQRLIDDMTIRRLSSKTKQHYPNDRLLLGMNGMVT